MQIKDLAFSDKCLIDCKWPLHYQFYQGTAVSVYQWWFKLLHLPFQIDSFDCLGCSLRSGKIQAKMRWLWNGFEGRVLFRVTSNRIQINGLAFRDKCRIDCKCPLKCQLQYKWVSKTSHFSEGRLYQLAASSVHSQMCSLDRALYTYSMHDTVWSIHCEAYSVQCTVISLEIGPETTITMMVSFLANRAWNYIY